MNFSGTLPSFKNALLFSGLLFLLLGSVGCGSGASSPATVAFQADEAITVTNTPGQTDQIRQQPLDLRFRADTIRVDTLPVIPFADSTMSFGADVSDVTITSVETSERSFSLSLTWRTKEASHSSQIRIRQQSDKALIGETIAGQLRVVEALCLTDNCQTIAINLKRNNDGAQIHLRVYQRTEYLRSDKNLKKDSPALLKDAVKYHLPVKRFRIDVRDGRSFERLVVNRPVVEEIPSPFFSEDESEVQVVVTGIGGRPIIDSSDSAQDEDPTQIPANTTGSTDEAVENPSSIEPFLPSTNTVLVAPPSPVATEILIIPLEPENITPRPTEITETPTEAPGPLAANSQHIDVTVTPNPHEAFNIELPADLFNQNQYISDPRVITEGLEIVPPRKQSPGEPSARIAAIAKAFVDQDIKVYRNACNIFVRSVLAIAGYTEGQNYLADEFHYLFQENPDLSRWNKTGYTGTQNLAQQQDKLYGLLTSLEDNMAVVSQWRRTGNMDFGHVGFLMQENSELIVIDAALDGPGPRIKPVPSKSYLLSPNRSKVNIFSEPAVLRAR